MNKVFYIKAYNADGHDIDLMVSAIDPQDAFELWEKYYYPDTADWQDYGEEPHDYTTGLVTLTFAEIEKTDLTDDVWGAHGIVECDLRIYALADPGTISRVYPWHSPECKMVAFVKESM